MAAVQALSKLKQHWTNIAHHLYLKADCPVPLPAVGPLAELLHVTTTVCQEVNALAAAGKLTSEDISTALEANTVRLLGRLVQWLQAEPHEQLLLNTERAESLWQVLLLMLANMLKVLQPEQDVVVVDADLINRFKQQLQSSGVLGAGSAGSSSDGSSAQPAAAEPAAGGILSALHWLLQHHPHRCLTASMGAWLLLIELGATDSTLPQQHAGDDAPADAAAAAAGKDGAAVLGVSPFAASDGLTSGLATVLQAYVDCAYANVKQPPAAPLPQAAGGPASGRSSGATTPVRKMASREKIDSSSVSSPAVTPPQKKRGPAAAAPAAAPEDGSPGGHTGEGKAAAVDAGAVLKGVAHAVCLIDDPSTPVFLHLLALLHSLQIQLLVLAARGGECLSRGGEEQDSGTGALQLPHATHMQVLAAASTWLQQQAGEAAAAAAGGGQQYVHETLLQLPAVALAGLRETGMDSLAAVQQLVEICSKSLQQDCIHFITAKRKQQQQQQREEPEQAPGVHNSSGSTAGSVGVVVDAAQVFTLLLDSVSLQQACGAAVTEECLNGVAVAARGCTRPEVQQLLQQRGTELLHVLLRYIQHDPRQQQQQQRADSSSTEAGADAADAAAAAEQDYYMPRRCVACAQVFMDVCSMGRRGVDEDLLGCLTERDPATFYAIMDLLVRKVHPDSLTVLLPMSACFLQHDMSAVLELKEQQRQRKQEKQQQQQPEGEAAAAGSAEGTAPMQDEEQPSSSSISSISSSDVQELIAASRSLVILQDPDVCRTFAAALHGYCKTAFAHLDDLPAGGDADDVHGCSGHSCGHEHHGHEHEHHHHHHHGHERSVSSTLPPLHQVVGWLLCSYDITMRAAGDDSATQDLKAADAAAAAAAGGSDGSSGDRVLASVNKQAKQLQAASQAAAGSLVLTILLVRAAAPVLDWMQKELQQLPPAAAAAGSSSSSSTAGDVVLPLGAAMDLYAGLAFVRNVWQAICARYALSTLLEEQLGKLLRVSSAGYAAWTAQSEKLSSRKGGAAAAAADGPGAAAVAEAERVAKGLQMAAAKTKAVLLGRGLARGWSHLAFLMPQEALVAARDFQTTWPGDLLQECKASSALEAARDKLQQHAGDSSSSGSNGEQQHVVLQAHAHQELQRLTRDAQRMFAAVMDDIPLPVGCNNPGCTRIEAVAEATLSINKRCSQCLAAHYCCKECQREHWPSHKTACKRLRLQMPAAASKPA